MANTWKSNVSKNLSKSERAKRNKVEKKILNMDRDLLIPRDDFSQSEKELFEYTVQNNPYLSNLDLVLLNQYVRSYGKMELANKQLMENGHVINNSTSPYFQIYKDSRNNMLKLSTTLNLTPKSRPKQVLDEIEKGTSDPIKALMMNHE